MIKKLTDYGKRMNVMTLQEKEEYLRQVKAWLHDNMLLLRMKMAAPEAVYQSAVQCSMSWNDSTCAAFEQGARLLSSLMGQTDTWLPDMLYEKSAKRTIRKMLECLLAVHKEGARQPESAVLSPQAQKQQDDLEKAALEKMKKELPPDTFRQAVLSQPEPPTFEQAQGEMGGAPVRPRHIDQYIHLMPEELQQRAAKVRDLLREEEELREKARLLLSTGDATARAQLMTRVTKIDDTVRAVYRDLDTEWDRLVKSGRVVVDGLGNARIVPGPATTVSVMSDEERARQTFTETMAEESAAKEKTDRKAGKAKEDRQRKAAMLRKWLIDTRYAATPDHNKKWKKKYVEMVKLGGMEAVTDRVRAAAEFYGMETDAGKKVEKKTEKKTEKKVEKKTEMKTEKKVEKKPAKKPAKKTKTK